jgi:alpha-1,6-mannosyltransferase
LESVLGATPREFESRILRATPPGVTADDRPPYAALVAIGGSIALVALVAALGPSAVEPPLPGAGGAPPYAGTAHPPAGLVVSLLGVAVALGAVGIWRAELALRRGWAPAPRRLLAAAALAAGLLALTPPIGTADPQSYAAYGRLAATGRDPYATTPAELAATGDPVGRAVEPPWQHTPSVYGPLATAEQALVARVAGPSVRTIVGLLAAINAGAFLGTGLLLDRLAGRYGIHARRRAALLWTLNPLLLYQLVAGAHLDALVAFAVAGALVVLRRSPLLAGLAVGAAAAVKAPAALVGAGLAWALLPARRRLLALAAGAALVVLPAYAAAGPQAPAQLGRASRLISAATPWRVPAHFLDPALGAEISRRLIGVLALLAAAALAVVLARGLPRRAGETGAAVRGALVLTLAYLLVAPYALPWYDATAWALIALLPASTYDRILLARTATLSLGYLVGRVVPLSDPVRVVTSVLRSGLAPAVLAGLVVATVIAARPRQRPAPAAALR